MLKVKGVFRKINFSVSGSEKKKQILWPNPLYTHKCKTHTHTHTHKVQVDNCWFISGAAVFAGTTKEEIIDNTVHRLINTSSRAVWRGRERERERRKSDGRRDGTSNGVKKAKEQEGDGEREGEERARERQVKILLSLPPTIHPLSPSLSPSLKLTNHP